MMNKMHDEYGFDMAILKDKEVIPTKDQLEWGKNFALPDRILAKTEIGDACVSTVFLGINHGTENNPLWFETMIFGGACDKYCDRYATYDEAIKGHEKVKAML